MHDDQNSPSLKEITEKRRNQSTHSPFEKHYCNFTPLEI